MTKIRVNIPFNFAIPGPFHLFVRALLGLGTGQNSLDKNSWILDNQIQYTASPRDKWIGKFFSYSVVR